MLNHLITTPISKKLANITTSLPYYSKTSQPSKAPATQTLSVSTITGQKIMGLCRSTPSISGDSPNGVSTNTILWILKSIFLSVVGSYLNTSKSEGLISKPSETTTPKPKFIKKNGFADSPLHSKNHPLPNNSLFFALLKAIMPDAKYSRFFL